jgi:hypothetical protein
MYYILIVITYHKFDKLHTTVSAFIAGREWYRSTTAQHAGIEGDCCAAGWRIKIMLRCNQEK